MDQSTLVSLAPSASSFADRIAAFARDIKLSHTLFAMPFALLSMTLAASRTAGGLRVGHVVLIVLCMVFARTSRRRSVQPGGPRRVARCGMAVMLSIAFRASGPVDSPDQVINSLYKRRVAHVPAQPRPVHPATEVAQQRQLSGSLLTRAR